MVLNLCTSLTSVSCFNKSHTNRNSILQPHAPANIHDRTKNTFTQISDFPLHIVTQSAPPLLGHTRCVWGNAHSSSDPLRWLGPIAFPLKNRSFWMPRMPGGRMALAAAAAEVAQTSMFCLDRSAIVISLKSRLLDWKRRLRWSIQSRTFNT